MVRKDQAASPVPYHPGMTLRDWFAGQAMPHIWVALANADHRYDADAFAQKVAAASYETADAMLAEREKE